MVCPTAMVFTPCRDGISHSPLEYASPENCSIGAQTILGAVLRYDEILKKKYSAWDFRRENPLIVDTEIRMKIKEGLRMLDTHL